ncbi:hypothetical protein EVAR_35947_1 [Eumeta japonica]|uniref:Uncharacterized protein n=1 Tax=Eumeta variegata TaxID=151549 RepID=A0A4C1W595_EUMVA|nr:hypothetical protein EVAR_35947_1 [Eumeta japonica]
MQVVPGPLGAGSSRGRRGGSGGSSDCSAGIGTATVIATDGNVRNQRPNYLIAIYRTSAAPICSVVPAILNVADIFGENSARPRRTDGGHINSLKVAWAGRRPPRAARAG